MQEMSALGKMLILTGVIIVVIGIVIAYAGKIPWLGRLPGDIIIKKGNFTGYFMFGTSILLSIILTLLFWLLGRR